MCTVSCSADFVANRSGVQLGAETKILGVHLPYFPYLALGSESRRQPDWPIKFSLKLHISLYHNQNSAQEIYHMKGMCLLDEDIISVFWRMKSFSFDKVICLRVWWSCHFVVSEHKPNFAPKVPHFQSEIQAECLGLCDDATQQHKDYFIIRIIAHVLPVTRLIKHRQKNIDKTIITWIMFQVMK